MRKKRKLRSWVKVFFVFFCISLFFAFFGKAFSRYYDSLVNISDLSLAPWVISINEQKITSAEEANIIVEPIITEVTTNTKTYNNKIVPGCKGYFDVVIDPTGTGVSVDYIIDFNPEKLPGGMIYTKYETLNENKSVINTYDTLPSNSKLTGTLSLVDGNLLDSKDILRYRIYWDYRDDDLLNTTIPDVDNQNSIMISVTLKQSL